MMLRTALYFLAGIVLVVTGIGSIVYFSFNIALQVIGAMGSWAALGILAYYALTSVPTFQGAGAWIARGLSFWKTGEKSAVALKIQQSLNSAQEEINDEAKGIIPYPAKVEWIDKPSYLDTDAEVVVIRMKEHEENPRNVAYAVVDYITKGMIPFSRLYVDIPIQTAIDSTMVKKILLERDQSALDYFLMNVLNKKMNEEIQKYMKIMNNLNEHGLFTRVYLEELKELGLELYPIEDQYALRETKELLVQLNALASRKSGERKGAEPYIGKRIKVGYLLIADPSRLLMEGSKPYLQHALQCIEKGAKVIYLLSRGVNNKPSRQLADEIAKKCNMKIVNLAEFEEIIENKKMRALCIELRSERLSQEQEEASSMEQIHKSNSETEFGDKE
jgi:hypothetical protein